MNKRIRLIREDKKLSRAAFGAKLGVSGDVINNLERGRVKPKDHIIKLICTEYSVNEEWLRYGTGTMYMQPNTFSLDNFMKQRNATDLEIEIIKTYFELEPEIRKAALEYFKKISKLSNTVSDREEEYKKTVLTSASKTVSTATNTMSDMAKTNNTAPLLQFESLVNKK